MSGFRNAQETGGSVAILDEGVSLTPKVASIDFKGAGVTGTVLGSAVTTTIPGGASMSSETPVGIIDGVNTIFTVTNNPKLVFLNGAFQTAGGVDYTLSGSYTITFVSAPVVDSQLKSFY